MIKPHVKVIYKRLHPMDDVRSVRHFHNVGGDIRVRSYPRPRRQSMFSVVALVLILALNVSLAHAGSVISYFSDKEYALGNALHAGSLDFTVDPKSAEAYIGTVSGDHAFITPVLIPGPDSFPIEYKVTAKKIAGADAFCNALQASATTTPFNYNGSLLSLATATTTIPGPWQVEIRLPSGAPGISGGDTCSVDLVYTGWNAGGQEGSGYEDQQRVSLLISAGIDDDSGTTTTATSTENTTATTTSNTAQNIGIPGSASDSGSTLSPPNTATSTSTATSTEEIATSTGSTATTTEVIVSTTTPATTASTTTSTISTTTEVTSSENNSESASSSPPVGGSNTTIPPATPAEEAPPPGEDSSADPGTNPASADSIHGDVPTAPIPEQAVPIPETPQPVSSGE